MLLFIRAVTHIKDTKTKLLYIELHTNYPLTQLMTGEAGLVRLIADLPPALCIEVDWCSIVLSRLTHTTLKFPTLRVMFIYFWSTYSMT